MTPEQKDLLLKDLCARLPYGVICQCDKIKAEGTLREIEIYYNMCRLYDSFTNEFENCYIFDCKPYLFPLSSMTEEQKRHYHLLQCHALDALGNPLCFDCYDSLDWLNKNQFDYRGLIPMGLANDATGLNIY